MAAADDDARVKRARVVPESSEDVLAAFRQIEAMLPPAPFFARAVLKHQLYALTSNRTATDRELATLVRAGELYEFHFTGETGETFLMSPEAYFERLRTVAREAGKSEAIEQFIEFISTHRSNLSVGENIGGVDDAILVQTGALNLAADGRRLLAVPGMGPLVADIMAGRQEALQAVRRSKYREILETVLLKRKLRKSRLPTAFHVADIIGGDYVVPVQSTTGRILRLP